MVDILEKLMKKKLLKKHQIFNVCSNNPINLMRLVKIMNKVAKNHCKIKKVKLQKVDVIKTHGDNSKLLKFVKKNKFYSVNEGLKNTYDWFKKNKDII